MKTLQNISFLFIGLLLNIPILFGQKVNEIEVFDSLIDSLYSIYYCHNIVRPPYYKCCDNDTFSIEDFVKCCNNSNIPKEFRKYCKECINESQLDSLNLIMIVCDSLSKLDISNHREFILKHIPKKSDFYKLVDKELPYLPPIKFNIDSIFQKNVSFKKMTIFDSLPRQNRFGKNGKNFILGYLCLSRVYYNNQKNIGIFRMTYLGGSECGYDDYVLFYRDNEQWKIYKRITYGVY